MTNQNRAQAGVPASGEFAATEHNDSVPALLVPGAPFRLSTTAPSGTSDSPRTGRGLPSRML
ncbi:hypothetical protein [Arthrobacter sp. efr-133-TYG-120]|uniref:hypothetical protein n=1 Tax=Arthrobacter sp. efr-133-TYG-120 TaxID=3040280 RepID=UPI00254FAECA|nr:hypothetical protein [Arthrobacter sp. efr-133-TYG-120]